MKAKEEKELLELMIKNARLAGTYKGLLESLMCQLRPVGEFHVVRLDVFKRVQKALDKIDS